MHRRSSVESSKNPQSQVLHPTLRATLESLDIQLDEELSRYRRLQSHQRLKQGRTRQRLPQPDVVAVGALNGDRQPQSLPPSAPLVGAAVSPSKAVPTEPADVPSAQATAPLAIAPDINLAAPGELSSQPAAQPLANPDEVAPDDYLESSEELLKSIAEEEALRAEREPGLLESLLTPLGIGSMLLLLLSSVTFGYLIMNPSTLNGLGGQRVATGNGATTEPSPNIAPSSIEPNGAASGSLAGPSLDDPEFQSLNLDNLSSIPSNNAGRSTVAPLTPSATTGNTAMPPNAAVPPAVVVPSQAPVAAQPRSVVPTRPSTSSQRTAAQRPSAQRTASASQSSSRRANSNRPAPPAPRRSAANPPAAAPRQPQPTQAESSRTAANSSSTRSAPVAPPPSQGDRYYVVTPYNSDRSLTQARQAVGDAYVRNFPSEGARVQMGVFSERQRAQQLMQDLQNQGITAEIYEP